MFSLPAHPVHAYENLVVVIDPGHGGFSTEDETDTGACYNGVEEKTVDMITAQALYDELSQYGNLTVYLTRTEDKHMELQERVDFAKEVGADVLIAVHYNASAYHHFYGSEIFTSAYGEDYAKGHSLAETIMSWWVESGMLNKGIKTRIGNRGDYYGLIRMGHEAGIPTIILEHAYLDIDTDFSRISTPEDWKKMGILDATAIADYFGVKKGVVSADVGWNLTVPVPTAQVDDDKTPPTDINVTIDSFDPESGLLTYTVSAIDRESDLFYYDIDTEANTANEAECFSNLSVWESGKDSVQGSFIVPDGYRGKFVVRVFNIYQQHADSVPVSIPEEFLPEEERISFEKQSDEWKARKEQLAGMIDKLGSEIDGLARPDIAALEEQSQNAAGEYQQKTKELNEVVLKKHEVKENLRRWQELNQERQNLEEKSREYVALSKDLAGDNAKKISFESWILGVYLEEIAVHASRRLSRISDGRYSLHLKTDRASGHQRYAGLDLEIFDANTGKKRPCDTLSGGETFFVSISLALALTDVVQSRSGGVQLDSLFIDEGFGSLDDVTLEKALTVLDEIRENRMIGIISHVGELKNRIHRRIEVTKNQNGSTITLTGE
ncbi:MAG: N-acetylmuramoyl-L-alanine amidase [Lachnospiraceae bacterium]|nr:N-acetylmuramoyl-L-alanine amidase [Lachnospiraceae bacterium]